MTKQTRDKAIKVIRDNFEYLDDVIKHTIVNLLNDEDIIEGDNEFVWELQYIYDIYVATKKYGRQLT